MAFVRWQAAHGKSYKSAREAERRRGIFAANAGALWHLRKGLQLNWLMASPLLQY